MYTVQYRIHKTSLVLQMLPLWLWASFIDPNLSGYIITFTIVSNLYNFLSILIYLLIHCWAIFVFYSYIMQCKVFKINNWIFAVAFSFLYLYFGIICVHCRFASSGAMKQRIYYNTPFLWAYFCLYWFQWVSSF